MAFRRFLIALAAWLAVWGAAPVVAADNAAYVADVRLTRGSAQDLVLAFRVQQAMDQRVIDTLESGLAVRFTYWIRVQSPRRLFPDENLVDLKLERVLEKDNLKNRYRLTMVEGQPSRDVPNLAEALAVMSRVEGVSLLPLEVLGSRRPLYLRVRARLQRFEMPFRLHYVLPFVSYLDVGTDWYSLELPAPSAVQP
ncbi:MAG: DUF4390 domain-containing protein [Deferrisomatales bacterium]|nr:DUF4390 domain-containing protein [Deferrisomatales bacterium]